MPIDIGQSKKQGIYKDLKDTWHQQYPSYKEFEEVFYRRPKDSNVQVAQYAWKESIGFPSLWKGGLGRQHKSLTDRLLEIGYHGYELTLDVNSYDRRSDQLEDSKTHLDQGVSRFFQIPAKFIADFLNNSATLIPELTKAYDGQDLFANTADGLPRFGVNGGNILASSGFTVAQFHDDVFRAQQQFLNMKDPAGEPIWSQHDVTLDKLIAVVPPHLNRIALQAAQAKFFKTEAASNTAGDNILEGTFKPHLFNYLDTTSDWFVILNHPYWKPMILRQENNLRNFWADMSNSDRSRELNIETLYADQRVGAGIWCPFTIIQISA